MEINRPQADMQLSRLHDFEERLGRERQEPAVDSAENIPDPLLRALVSYREDVESRTRWVMRYQSDLAAFFAEQFDGASPSQLRDVIAFCDRQAREFANHRSSYLEAQDLAIKTFLADLSALLPMLQPDRARVIREEADRLLSVMGARLRHGLGITTFLASWRDRASDQMHAKSQPRAPKDLQRRAIERALKKNKDALAKLAKH